MSSNTPKESVTIPAPSLLSTKYKKLFERDIFNKDPFIHKLKKPDTQAESQVIPHEQKVKLPNISELKSAKTSGSFNVEKLNQEKWKKMHPTMKAKYISYSVPPAPIAAVQDTCAKRSRQQLKKQKEEIQEMVNEMEKLILRKRGILDKDEQQRVEDSIKKTKQRMQAKNYMQKRIMDAEFQTLIEGQKNSIDAIRLKEYLSTKESIKIDKSLKPSLKEHLRLQDIMNERGAPQ